MSPNLLTLITVANYIFFGLILLGLLGVAVTIPMMFANASAQSGSRLGVFYLMLGLYPLTYLISIIWSLSLRLGRTATPNTIIAVSLIPAVQIILIVFAFIGVMRSL